MDPYIQGCLAAALVDHESGMCPGSKANGFPIEVAAAGNTEVLRTKIRVMNELRIEGGIQDMRIALDTQLHLIVPLRRGSLFLYIAVDRKVGNLAMARHELASIEKTRWCEPLRSGSTVVAGGRTAGAVCRLRPAIGARGAEFPARWRPIEVLVIATGSAHH